MKRRVFFSFHYEKDNWRAGQVRNMGILDGNAPISDNDWETVKKGGDNAIEKWIESQMEGKTCCIVLIGEDTAARKWINFEIQKAWERELGLVGIYIHGLKDRNGNTSRMGENPFSGFKIGSKNFDQIVKAYNPNGKDSSDIYNSINQNLSEWVEEAIEIRSQY